MEGDSRFCVLKYSISRHLCASQNIPNLAFNWRPDLSQYIYTRTSLAISTGAIRDNIPEFLCWANEKVPVETVYTVRYIFQLCCRLDIECHSQKHTDSGGFLLPRGSVRISFHRNADSRRISEIFSRNLILENVDLFRRHSHCPCT